MNYFFGWAAACFACGLDAAALDAVQSRQPHAVGVLQQQVLAGDRELALRVQLLHGVRHQLRSVAQNGDGPPGGKLRELLAQLLGHERAVIGQAGHLIVRIKAGGVDLAARGRTG